MRDRERWKPTKVIQPEARWRLSQGLLSLPGLAYQAVSSAASLSLSMSHLVLGLGHQKKGVEVVPGSKGAEWWTGEELEEQRALSSASNLQGQPRATRLNIQLLVGSLGTCCPGPMQPHLQSPLLMLWPQGLSLLPLLPLPCLPLPSQWDKFVFNAKYRNFFQPCFVSFSIVSFQCCQFLLYSEANQLHICIYTLPPGPSTQPPVPPV